jgi:hypothetical protein
VTARDPARELAGWLGVEATARRVRHYRYAEERMMRVLAGWIALTPELPAKLLLGRQVWDCAQHADLWAKRLPELRAPAQVSEPPNAAFVRFMDALETRYLGPMILVVQERWVQAGDGGGWRVHEAELARIAVEAPG